jgi:hypothetical protein
MPGTGLLRDRDGHGLHAAVGVTGSVRGDATGQPHASVCGGNPKPRPGRVDQLGGTEVPAVGERGRGRRPGSVADPFRCANPMTTDEMRPRRGGERRAEAHRDGRAGSAAGRSGARLEGRRAAERLPVVGCHRPERRAGCSRVAVEVPGVADGLAGCRPLGAGGGVAHLRETRQLRDTDSRSRRRSIESASSTRNARPNTREPAVTGPERFRRLQRSTNCDQQ